MDKTTLANMAFAHCGISQTVVDIDATTETTTHADQFNVFYPTVLDAVYTRYKPDFPIKQAALSLIQENPNLTWKYEYTYPTDCLVALGLTDGSQLGVDTFTEMPYIVANDGSDRVIWTNEESISLDYLSSFTVISKVPPDFALALSYIMAGYIAPSITENRNSGFSLQKQGENDMLVAMAGITNERGVEPQPDAEIIRGRA